jgi:hypothetical protein
MELIFHIGQSKTASTAIQSGLNRNRCLLAAQGLLYPKSLGAPKSSLVPSFADQSSNPGLSAVCNRIHEQLRAEILPRYDKMLISEERLFNLGIAQQLQAAFAPYATSWRILCYIRRPDDHLVSRYYESVRDGGTLTLPQYFERRLRGASYHYRDRMKPWSDVFGYGAIEVRLFPNEVAQGGVWRNFVQWLGLKGSALFHPQDKYENRSLDRVNIAVLRFLNICASSRPDLLEKYQVLKWSRERFQFIGLLDRLWEFDTGDRLRLDPEWSRLLLARVRENNENFAERYLSPTQAGWLLASPSNSSPSPPLDKQALFERMMLLFDNPTLAGLAVDCIAT